MAEDLVRRYINPLILKWNKGEELNKLLSYTQKGKSLELHAMQIDADAFERLELFTEGLKKLAKKNRK